MVVESSVEEFERKQAMGADAFALRGTVPFNTGGISGVSQLLGINPSSFGARANNLASVFSRYRVKELMIEFFVNTGTATNTAGQAVVGILDDGPGEADVPNNYADVLEMRCSNTNYFGQTTPSFLRWKPLDPQWRYTQFKTGDDARLVNTAVIWTATTAAAAIVGQIRFSIVFKGASDTGSSVSIPSLGPPTEDEDDDSVVIIRKGVKSTLPATPSRVR
jgi:hypothetical protein